MKRSARMTAAVTVFFLFAGLLPLSATADLTGAGDAATVAKLSQLYAVMKEYLDNAKQVLQEARIQSDNLKDMRDLSKEVYKEYKFVKNFNAQYEIDRLQDDINGLTYLDNMDGKSTKEQINLLLKEVDRRIRRSTTAKEREKHKQTKEHLLTIERLSALQDAKTQEVADITSQANNEKTLQASTASSTALISSLMLAEEQRRLQRETNQIQEEQERIEDFETMDEILDKMKED